MTRGHPPYVAIGEAMRKARAQDHLVFALEPAGELPVHFVTMDGDCISLVRIRRLKYPGYTVEEIEESCKKDIAELRSITVTAEIFREIWVRGPDRHWYRYLVLPESVEAMEDGDVLEEDKPDNGDTPVLKPEGPAEQNDPDTRVDGADTGNQSGSLQTGIAGPGSAGTPAPVVPPA